MIQDKEETNDGSDTSADLSGRGVYAPWRERGLGCCEQHERLFDLQAGAEEWELTLKILRPWVEASKHIGVSLLEEVMDDALRRAEKDQSYCRANLERAETEAL